MSEPVDQRAHYRDGVVISGNVNAKYVVIGNNNLQIEATGGRIAIVDPRTLPSPRRLARPVSCRPRPPLPFSGRVGELAALREMVRQHRPIEVVGAEGTGKTWLLRQLAQEDFPDLPDGVAYLLTPLRGLPFEDVVREVFDQFFERFSSPDLAYVPTRAELRRGLSDVRALVVLDDVDVDLAAARAVTDHLPAASILFARTASLLPEAQQLQLADYRRAEAITGAASTFSTMERRIVELLEALDGHWLSCDTVLGTVVAAEAQRDGDVRSECADALRKLIRMGIVVECWFERCGAAPERQQPMLILASIHRRRAATRHAVLAAVAALFAFWHAYGCERLREERGAILRALRVAHSLGAHRDTMFMVRRVSASLLASGSWGTWTEAMVLYRASGAALGLDSEVASASEQLRLAEFCRGGDDQPTMPPAHQQQSTQPYLLTPAAPTRGGRHLRKGAALAVLGLIGGLAAVHQVMSAGRPRGENRPISDGRIIAESSLPVQAPSTPPVSNGSSAPEAPNSPSPSRPNAQSASSAPSASTALSAPSASTPSSGDAGAQEPRLGLVAPVEVQFEKGGADDAHIDGAVITLRNDAATPLMIKEVVPPIGVEAPSRPSCAGKILRTGDSCELKLRLSGEEFRPFHKAAPLTIRSTAGPVTVLLRPRPAELQAEPNQVNFVNRDGGVLTAATIRLRNRGGTPLAISKFEHSPGVSVVGAGCLAREMHPDQSCTIELSARTTTSPQAKQLRIHSTAPNSPLAIKILPAAN